jgi:hypothetical protein
VIVITISYCVFQEERKARREAAKAALRSAGIQEEDEVEKVMGFSGFGSSKA